MSCCTGAGQYFPSPPPPWPPQAPIPFESYPPCPQLFFFFFLVCTCRWVTILEHHHQNTPFRAEKQIPGSSHSINNEEGCGRRHPPSGFSLGRPGGGRQSALHWSPAPFVEGKTSQRLHGNHSLCEEPVLQKELESQGTPVIGCLSQLRLLEQNPIVWVP